MDGTPHTPATSRSRGRGLADEVYQSPPPPKQASLSASRSLASSLSAFAPPTPGPKQFCAAALAQASDELADLAEAARCAASACPESIPLVEALCAAVAEELLVLKAEKASASSNKTLNSAAVSLLSHRVSELRAATAEGLQALRKALEACAQADVERAVSKPYLAPALVRTESSPLLQQLPDRHSNQRELAQIFGAVASNMKQAVLEIRQTKARQAVTRSDSLMGASP